MSNRLSGSGQSQIPVPTVNIAPGGSKKPPAKKSRPDNPLSLGPTQLSFPQAPPLKDVSVSIRPLQSPF